MRALSRRADLGVRRKVVEPRPDRGAKRSGRRVAAIIEVDPNVVVTFDEDEADSVKAMLDRTGPRCLERREMRLVFRHRADGLTRERRVRRFDPSRSVLIKDVAPSDPAF